MSLSTPPPASLPLRRAREIRASHRRRPAGPDHLLAAHGHRSEDLVLEVAGVEALRELDDLLRFLHVPRERLLAGDAEELALAGVDDLLDRLKPHVVGAADPDGVDVRGLHHVGDGLVGLRLAHAQVARELRGGFGLLHRPAADAEHVRVADADERLDVEPAVEPGPDDADPQPLGHSLPSNWSNSRFR
jgi:hypothetical protein